MNIETIKNIYSHSIGFFFFFLAQTTVNDYRVIPFFQLVKQYHAKRGIDVECIQSLRERVR